MKIKPKHLLAIAVFLIAFTILLISVTDYGLTWDEPYYIAHGNRLQQWFGLLIQNQAPFSDDAVNNLIQFDRYHNCHPPFYKLSGLLFKNLIGKYLYSNILYQYRVSTIFWSALLIAILFLYLHHAYQSHLIALLGAGLFFTVPRFFVHMHLFATDAIIVSLYFVALYLFVFGKNRVSAILGGLFGGALLASKFTGVLLFPILLIIAPCFSDRKEYARRFIFFIPATILGFVLFDIHLWVGFWQEIIFYFRSVLDRESVVTIGTLFFGKVYDFRLPWYQPLIMLGICIPFALIVFAIFSPMFGNFNRYRKFWLFEILPLIFLILIFSLPRTPKHDGIRLFSLAWPHLVLLSIRGVCGISRLINWLITNRVAPSGSKVVVRIKRGVITALLFFTLLINISTLIKYHPYQLSFYNAAIGGPAGAAKKGFTISYWYEALDQTFFSKLNARYKNDSVVIFSYPNSDILEYNRVLGLVNSEIKTTSNPQEADYILIMNRIIRQQMSKLIQGQSSEITASTPDNVWILSLFENSQKRLKQVSYLQQKVRRE
jgi:4-amino-4-deoxy-L-arabinose transferase-like glycosyltransferase